MLLLVVGIAAIALLTLLVAVMFGSVLAGWITIWASTAGLLLLLVDAFRRHDDNDDRQDADVAPPPRLDVAPPPRLDVASPDDRNPSIATELTDVEVELYPDIWPPEHPVHQTLGDDSRSERRRASERESLHPDIWP